MHCWGELLLQMTGDEIGNYFTFEVHALWEYIPQMFIEYSYARMDFFEEPNTPLC